MKFNRLLLAPNTAETGTGGAGPGKPEPLTLTKISYQVVVDLPVEQQDALMKKFNARVVGLKETQKDVKTESKYAAILLAGVETRVKRGIEARIYPSTFTVSDLYKQVTGEKPPGHVYTLKNAYVNFVLSSLIEESDFIANRNNCLELAQKIADAVFEHDPETGLKHEAVSRAANELITRTDNEAKILRGILASVKPAKLMTAEQALEAFAEICASGNLPVVLAQMPDEIKAMGENAQKEAYVACFHSLEKVEKELGTQVEAWLKEAVDAQAPVQITNGAPAAAPATEAAPAPETAELVTA